MLLIAHDLSKIHPIFCTLSFLDLVMTVDSNFLTVLALLVFLVRSRPNSKSFLWPSSALLLEFFHSLQLYPDETLFIEQQPTLSFGSPLTTSQSDHSGQNETFAE